MIWKICRRLGIVLILVVVARVAPASAQSRDSLVRQLSASVGLLQYELSDDGVAPAFAFRAARPMNSVVMAEVSVLGARPATALGRRSTFLLPEAQLQLAFPFTRFQPFVGLGAGAALEMQGEPGGTNADLTISGSLGVQTWLGRRLGAVIEYRARGIGTDFHETTSEYTGGVLWRL